MGETLNRRPISQQQGFATLNTASSPFSQQQAQQPQIEIPSPQNATVTGMPKIAGTLGAGGGITSLPGFRTMQARPIFNQMYGRNTQQGI